MARELKPQAILIEQTFHAILGTGRNLQFRLRPQALCVNENVLVVFPSPDGVNAVSAIYLDHQATSGLAPGVLAAMNPYFSDSYGNPHSSEHAFGWRSADAVEAARGQIAQAVGADAGEVLFTSGATEANNLVLLGFDRDASPRLITTTIEHKSVIAPIRERGRRGCETVFLPVDGSGIVNLAALEAAVLSGPALVSIMAVNNEIGTAQPLPTIAEICRRAGALLHVDAAQALPFGAVHSDVADADFVSLSSHKAGGPMGIGAVVIAHHARERLSPILFGGGQEDGLRPGTLPTALCVGFSAACSTLPTPNQVDEWRRRGDALAEMLRAEVPGLRRNGGGSNSHPGSVSVTLPAGDAHVVIAKLQPHLAVSTGSACTSGMPEPSHVLRAIGLDSSAAERTIRLSVGRFTGHDELAAAAREIGAAVRAAG